MEPVVKHTVECTRATKREEREREAYLQKWPHICDHCFGEGGFWAYEVVMRGDVIEPPDFCLCSECTEAGLCARCGGLLIDPEVPESYCSVCGWAWNDCVPEVMECNGECLT